MDEIDAEAAAATADERNAPPPSDAQEIETAQPAQPELAEDRASRIERAIEAWVEGHIHNSPVSRDTGAFNHLRSRLGDLARLIREEIDR